VLTVERLAMPEYWLDKPLRDWLLDQLKPGESVVRQGVVDHNGHRCERLLSARKIGWVSSCRGIRRLRCDLAWTCPQENRVYRVSHSAPSDGEGLELPGTFSLRCCRPAPAVQRVSP